ncbi:MAG: RNA-binding S4 domain-containing protein [Clostridia bacterium]|nr:RNA-binding S4 domain-containing protein [Clostridia bacterium]
MRLDKYLMVSRIIKRRTVSNNACDSEKVSVNGRVVKASYNVKVGDIIEVTFGERTLKVRVKDIKEHTLKSNAAELYEVIDQ